jgi:hypothetical protein
VSKLKLFLWRAFEYVFARVSRVKEIHPGQQEMFLIANRTYYGRAFIVQGVPVHRRDKVVELHVNNELVMKILRQESSLVAVSVRLLVETKKALPALAAYLADDRFADRQVLYGISFMHRGISRLGFETFPIHDGLLKRLITWHLKRLFRIVNPHSEDALRHREADFVPKMVAMSKQELMRRYLHTNAQVGIRESNKPVSAIQAEAGDVQTDG